MLHYGPSTEKKNPSHSNISVQACNTFSTYVKETPMYASLFNS